MPRSACIEQGEQFTCNHYLQSFLTYLKQERGFRRPHEWRRTWKTSAS